MTKKNKTPFGIFIESIGLYFSNFGQFVKYMTFPVLGQIFGLVLTLSLAIIYSKNLPQLIEKYQIFNNFNTLVIFAIIISLPGIIIFTKAFWEYLVAYGAINSMLENMLKSGKVYDFSAHTELIKRRTASFVMLWLIVGIFSILAFFPLFWVPAGIIAIYMVLIFQAFTYEPELSPVGCVKKSFTLIKGHFGATFLLIFLSGLLCWFLIPQLFNSLFENTGICKLLSNAVTPFIETMPVTEWNYFLVQFHIPEIKNSELAMFIVSSSLAQILIQYTLPLRSIMCGLWYKELNGEIPSSPEKKKTSKKRPSEKLMEESNKKFVKRLDKNILKRAMEKDEE